MRKNGQLNGFGEFSSKFGMYIDEYKLLMISKPVVFNESV